MHCARHCSRHIHSSYIHWHFLILQWRFGHWWSELVLKETAKAVGEVIEMFLVLRISSILSYLQCSAVCTSEYRNTSKSWDSFRRFLKSAGVSLKALDLWHPFQNGCISFKSDTPREKAKYGFWFQGEEVWGRCRKYTIWEYSPKNFLDIVDFYLNPTLKTCFVEPFLGSTEQKEGTESKAVLTDWRYDFSVGAFAKHVWKTAKRRRPSEGVNHSLKIVKYLQSESRMRGFFKVRTSDFDQKNEDSQPIFL